MHINEEQEMNVEDFFAMCEKDGGVYQIDTPDGWVNINLLLMKSNKECVSLRLQDGFEINCASSHLVKTEHGWKEAINLDILEDRVLTKNGYKKIVTIDGIVNGDSFDLQTTFDFNIDSDSSAYYANNVVSHNSGKSLAAKCAASLFQIPLLRLDFGALFGQYIGESERQARQAIQLAEKVSPCVSGDTLIHTTDGISRRIDELLENNVEKDLYVYTLNENTLLLEQCKIKAVIKQPFQKEMLKITTWFNSITTTEEHKLMVIRDRITQWIPSSEIVVGDLLVSHKKAMVEKLVDSDIIGVEVKKIEKSVKQDCYDLFIDTNHNFFANGILSKNCVLWCDEIDKGLSGHSSGGRSDSGVTARVISTFLTWMQERTGDATVFFMCTANEQANIPTEFLRAGRFDEIFFVDLPTKLERIQITSKLLLRKKRDPKNFDISTIANRADGYTGAEIEKAIDMALRVGFSDNRREITTNDIITALGRFKPLSKVRPEAIEAMQLWASERCIKANTPDPVPTLVSTGNKALDLNEKI